MEKPLVGKVALVTGAGRGAGRRVAQGLARLGAAVAANDVTPVNLDETLAAIRSAGGQASGYVADLARKMPVQSLIQQVLDELGRLDILVNCAEVEPQRAVLEMDDWDWQRTLEVNLGAAFLLTQVAGRVMRERGSGVIIHIGERARGPGLRGAYFASKAGLAAFVEHVRPELEVVGVRLHCIVPQPGRDILEQVLFLCR